MRLYVTVDGDLYNLDALSAEHREYFEQAWRAYQKGVAWESFGPRVFTSRNPVVAEAHGRITRDVWRHPLFRVLYDLDERLGIAQGHVERVDVDLGDPFRLSNETISTTEAVARKGVTMWAIHLAVERGDLIAEEAAKGQRTVLRVSVESLDRWKPLQYASQGERKAAASA